MNLDLILHIAAFVCFLVATIGVTAGPVNLVALGLALWVLTTIV